jgi:hypothetical protein
MKMEGYPSAGASPSTRHSRARGNAGLFSAALAWIPAFAGMTEPGRPLRCADHPRTRIFEEGHEGQEVENFNWRTLRLLRSIGR